MPQDHRRRSDWVAHRHQTAQDQDETGGLNFRPRITDWPAASPGWPIFFPSPSTPLLNIDETEAVVSEACKQGFQLIRGPRFLAEIGSRTGAASTGRDPPRRSADDFSLRHAAGRMARARGSSLEPRLARRPA